MGIPAARADLPSLGKEAKSVAADLPPLDEEVRPPAAAELSPESAPDVGLNLSPLKVTPKAPDAADAEGTLDGSKRPSRALSRKAI